MFALVFVGASTNAIGAAECIAKPNAQAPQGKHWYYRTDRATKRQCWYLGPQNPDVQKSATAASKQQASDARTLPAAPAHAQRPTATAPEVGPAATATEANVPAPAAPPPWPEEAKLPDVPPTFEPAPTPVLAERQQSVDAIDPAPTPASEKSQSPANARSSPASGPAQSTADADHTLALAMIVFAVIVISGSVFEVTRWLNRRKASNRHRLQWAHPSTSSTPYPLARTSLDFDSRTPARHIPPPPKPLEQEEKELAQALQQLLNETQTKQPVEPLDQTEQLAQALQQVLNETQTKQHGPRLTPNIVRDRVSRRAELHHDQAASATDRDGTLGSMGLLLVNQRN
jgi:hypothetical protein